MFPRFAILFLLAVLPLATRGADVYKWVDENGRIHYGDAVPAQYKKKATLVEQKLPIVTDAQRQEAEARVLKDKTDADAMQAQRTKPKKLSPPASPGATVVIDDKAKDCQAQKQQYQEALKCFAPYVNANGSVKPEAYQLCPAVKEPQCR